jgi:hypothetical protein
MGKEVVPRLLEASGLRPRMSLTKYGITSSFSTGKPFASTLPAPLALQVKQHGQDHEDRHCRAGSKVSEMTESSTAQTKVHECDTLETPSKCLQCRLLALPPKPTSSHLV